MEVEQASEYGHFSSYNDVSQSHTSAQQTGDEEDRQSYDRIMIGKDVSCVPDINEVHKRAVYVEHFDYIICPLVHPRYGRSLTKGSLTDVREEAFTRSDLCFSSNTWSSQVVGKISPWINLDSLDPVVKRNSELAFSQEVAFAAHLAVPSILLHSPESICRCINYARTISFGIASTTYMRFWLTIPVHSEDDGHTTDTKEYFPTFFQQTPSSIKSVSTVSLSSSPSPSSLPTSSSLSSYRPCPWTMWNLIRTMCADSKRLGVCLELTATLPTEDALLRRWIGEPVRACIVPTSIFDVNDDGFPVLPQRHRWFLNLLFDHKVQFILKGQTPFTSGLVPYQYYLRDLYSRRKYLHSQEQFEAPYRDFLQVPLQPLADNLESQTYETFEKDPVKYRNYEQAVYRALVDKFRGGEVPSGGDAVSECRAEMEKDEEGKEDATCMRHRHGDKRANATTTNSNNSRACVLMVVGAGRGPLVQASIVAARRAQVPLRLYVIEKNPNAVVTLRCRMRRDWADQLITIVSTDMRTWIAPEKADILVSELLGSFGDNELSPECLDGAQRFLRDDGISIPSNSVSYLAPMSSSKLWKDVDSYGDSKHFEMPYVVRLHNFVELAPPQPCFTFVHPSFPSQLIAGTNNSTQSHASVSTAATATATATASTNKDLPAIAMRIGSPEDVDNSRFVTLKFDCKEAGVLHGFSGYFDSCLYKDVHISIYPPTLSKGMFSWFPIYFPIRVPLYIPKGTLEVSMWRACNRTQVWYEWCVISPTPTCIHNPGGRSYQVKL